jgi:hypothetical protein
MIRVAPCLLFFLKEDDNVHLLVFKDLYKQDPFSETDSV